MLTNNKVKYVFLYVCICLVDLICGCPTGCACVTEGQVICNMGGLTEVPVDLPSTTKHLSLNYNGITRLRADAFNGFPEIKTIHLDNNNITQLAPYSFRGVRDVDEITLQNNPLDNLPSYSFADMDNVDRLYLGYNRISSLHANAFYNSKNIREISFIGNPLVIICSHAFAGLNHVRFFHFPKGLRTIERDAFHGLTNAGLIGLENVTTVSLGRHTFRGLINVTGIEIRLSDIGSVHGKAFEGLRNVDHLGFNHNRFGLLEKEAFNGVFHVRNFVFEDNYVEDLEKDSLTGLNTVRRLSFTNNQIPCDCRLRYLSEILTKTKAEVSDVNYCNYPGDVTANTTSDIDMDQLNDCPIPTIVQPLGQYNSHTFNQATRNYNLTKKLQNLIQTILLTLIITWNLCNV